jgi:hypothetical protein
MRVLEPGHAYILANFENKEAHGQIIEFIKKDATSTLHDGTTNEEVLLMMIDRMNNMNAKFPCRENAMVITKLDEALMWLNKRTADRVKRGVEGKQLV